MSIEESLTKISIFLEEEIRSKNNIIECQNMEIAEMKEKLNLCKIDRDFCILLIKKFFSSVKVFFCLFGNF